MFCTDIIVTLNFIRSVFGDPVAAINWARTTIHAPRQTVNREQIIDAVADATGTERSRIRTYYDETTGPVADLYDRRLQATITDGPGARLRRRAVGFEHWVGLDRLAYYCLLRAESPSTVVRPE